MGLFVKIDGIEGESTDSNHAKWILTDSASLPVFRSIPGGAVDQQRTKGETSLGDITFTRQLDKSSPKLMEACALGKFNKEVLVELLGARQQLGRAAAERAGEHELHQDHLHVHRVRQQDGVEEGQRGDEVRNGRQQGVGGVSYDDGWPSSRG
jgi:hypothetical protein